MRTHATFIGSRDRADASPGERLTIALRDLVGSLIAESWAERYTHDVSLQRFVEAEVARMFVECQTLRYQNKHLRENVKTLLHQVKELRANRHRSSGQGMPSGQLFGLTP